MTKIFLIEATAYIEAASASSLAVGTGNKTFVLASDVKFYKGQTVTSVDGANSMTGAVVSYTKATKTLVVNVANTVGSGTHSAWTIGGTHVHRWSSGSGYKTEPSDTPPSVFYEPRIIDPGNFAINLFRNGEVLTQADVGSGTVEINNADLMLDDLINQGFDGRPVVIKRGEPGVDSFADFEVLFTGTMDYHEMSWNRIKLLLKDRLTEAFDANIQGPREGITDNVYAGDNSLPDGVEGTPADLKGKPKPVVYGQVFNVRCPVVNTSQHIYQMNWRQINSLDAVYSGGIALSAGTSRASLALLLANTPGAGTYDYYLGSSTEGAYFKLENALGTDITADFTQGAAAGNRTAAQIVKSIMLDLAELDVSDIDTDSFDDADTDNGSVVGIYRGVDEGKVGDMLNEVLLSISASLYLDKNGKFHIAVFKEPAVSSIATIKATDILRQGGYIERISYNDNTKGIPSNKSTLSYKKNYTVQNAGDLAGAATDARKAFVQELYRTVTTETASVKTKHLLSKVRQYVTLLTVEADAQAESDRVHALFNSRRDMIRVGVHLDVAPDVDLNDTVKLVVDRWDYAAGKNMRIIGIENLWKRNQVIYTLWG